MLVSFDIDYEGKKETIEYEDDIPFGDMEAIINTSVDLTNLNQPKVRLQEYRLLIIQKTLRKAPFDFKNINVVRALPHKTMKKVIEGVMKSYPLVECSGDWMTSLLGSEMVNELVSESMPTVQQNSVGQENKQEVTPQDSSKN